MCRNRCQAFAPSTPAASYNSRSMLLSPASARSVKKGTPFHTFTATMAWMASAGSPVQGMALNGPHSAVPPNVSWSIFNVALSPPNWGL